MAAKLHDISVLVHMAGDDEAAIWKVLEWGTDGVVIPWQRRASMRSISTKQREAAYLILLKEVVAETKAVVSMEYG